MTYLVIINFDKSLEEDKHQRRIEKTAEEMKFYMKIYHLIENIMINYQRNGKRFDEEKEVR